MTIQTVWGSIDCGEVNCSDGIDDDDDTLIDCDDPDCASDAACQELGVNCLDLLPNTDFEGSFTAAGTSHSCDLTADSVPDSWSLVETWSGCNEDSQVFEVADNGPTLPGSSALGIRRLMGGGSGDQTHVIQDAAIHARNFAKLTLSVDVKVLAHNLEGGGRLDPATEWPARVFVQYTDSSGNSQIWRYGWYLDPPGDGRAVDPGSGLLTESRDEQVQMGQWTTTTFDLLAELPELETIDRVSVGGSGWNFESVFDNVQLVGCRCVDLLVDEDFERPFTDAGTSDGCDLAADSIPSGWTRRESFSSCNEESEIVQLIDNGGSLSGSAAVGFRRASGGSSGDVTELSKALGLEVREFRSLTLSLDVKVLSHNLEAGGTVKPAFEWPARLQVVYMDTDGSPQSWRYGWYVDPPGDGRPVDPCPGMLGECGDRELTPDVWRKATFDLLAELPKLDTIVRIDIGGVGWDFESAFDNVRLIGTKRSLIPNADFEGGAAAQGLSNVCDLTADMVPTLWSRRESFSTCDEDSEVSVVSDNGPSFPGSSALKLKRADGQLTGDVTGVFQNLGLLASDFESLSLSVDVKVISHNLVAGGTASPAFEWPARVQIAYTDDDGLQQLWRYGWYLDPPGDGRDVDPCPGVIGECRDEEVPVGEWTTQQFDLFAELPGAVTLDRIDLCGSGWDFESLFDNVQLGCSIFKRGDDDSDNKLSIGDAIFSLSYQFLGTVTPLCLDALDFNDDGKIDTTDPIANLSHQFLGAPPPASPGKFTCGADPTPDADGLDLGCEAYPAMNCR